MLPIGTPRRNKREASGFTLIELMLVMAIILIVCAVVAPELSGFFKEPRLGRRDAAILLSLTRLGRSRAISEGLPVELWIDSKNGRYGMEALSGYTETRTNAIAYSLADAVKISITQPQATLTRSNYWTQTQTLWVRRLPMIRFQPDGYISDTSPKQIFFTGSDGTETWLAQDFNHLRYEIQTGPAPRTRR